MPCCIGEAGSAMLEHFNHLRRQWAAKAQFLVTNLKRITMVNVTEVIGQVKIIYIGTLQDTLLFEKFLFGNLRCFCGSPARF